mmetsp:Transcript_34913/g.70600  ORF Transcript_34913/g.70600 Transcript_34913/m.70600 type:complete len:253 (-) Transcript_34913:836-1594(-)
MDVSSCKCAPRLIGSGAAAAAAAAAAAVLGRTAKNSTRTEWRPQLHVWSSPHLPRGHRLRRRSSSRSSVVGRLRLLGRHHREPRQQEQEQERRGDRLRRLDRHRRPPRPRPRALPWPESRNMIRSAAAGRRFPSWHPPSFGMLPSSRRSIRSDRARTGKSRNDITEKRKDAVLFFKIKSEASPRCVCDPLMIACLPARLFVVCLTPFSKTSHSLVSGAYSWEPIGTPERLWRSSASTLSRRRMVSRSRPSAR